MWYVCIFSKYDKYMFRLFNSAISLHDQWWIQDFPRRGFGGGCKVLFGLFFLQKLHENKENWAMPDVCSRFT